MRLPAFCPRFPIRHRPTGKHLVHSFVVRCLYFISFLYVLELGLPATRNPPTFCPVQIKGGVTITTRNRDIDG
jgi:hypothetical protein